MEYRKVSDLSKLPNNPRTIKDKAFKKLCESLTNNKSYFEARPCILSDRTGQLVILAGNQRYDAAKSLGWLEVPTHLMSGLTEAQEKEIVIRDNVNSGEWDFDMLANGEWNSAIEWGLSFPTERNKKVKEEPEPRETCPTCGK